MGSIYVGADHRGFELKEFLKEELKKIGINIIDVGNEVYDENDDYVEISLKLSQKVLDKEDKGILICGSGVGVCISANKVKGIRAGLATSKEQARLARKDDDINVLCLTAELIDKENNLEIVKVFLETLFSGEERYVKRLNLLKKYEDTKIC